MTEGCERKEDSEGLLTDGTGLPTEKYYLRRNCTVLWVAVEGRTRYGRSRADSRKKLKKKGEGEEVKRQPSRDATRKERK